MSETMAAVRGRIRTRCRDTDSRKASFHVLDYDQAICDAYLAVQSRLTPPHLLTPNAFTIAAGSETFTLPTASAAQYAGDVRIQLVSNNLYLVKLTVEEINAIRNGVTQANQSIPYAFALYEDSAQVVQGTCYPRSRAIEVCNLFTTMVADDLRTAANLDAASVLFGRYAAEALIYYVASEMVARMVPEDLNLRRLSPAIIPVWRREAEMIMYREEARRSDLQNVGRVQRRVA